MKTVLVVFTILLIASVTKAQTGNSPDERLNAAILTLNLEDARAAIKDGASVKKGTSGSPIHNIFTAMQQGENYNTGMEIMKLLINSGADVNELEDNVTVLFRLPKSGLTQQQKVEVALLLLDKGAKTEIHGQIHMYPDGTPLMYACLFGDAGLVKLLAGKGANVNAKNDNLETPLIFTVKAEPDVVPVATKVNIIKTLLAKGANVNAKNDRGETAITLAKELDGNEIKDALAGKAVAVKETNKIAVKGDFGTTDVSANTFLMMAIQSSNLEDVKKAIALGAEVNLVTSDLATPLTSIMFVEKIKESVEIAKYLISKGASVNHVGEASSTPLYSTIAGYEGAKKNGVADAEEIVSLIDLLLQKKANVDFLTRLEPTPLMLAVQSLDIPLLKKLLPFSKNINVVFDPVRDKMTALNFAIGVDAHSKAVSQVFLKNQSQGASQMEKELPKTENVIPGLDNVIKNMGNASKVTGEAYDKEYQPLTLVFGTESERLEVIKLLLPYKANPNWKSRAGITPLMQAKAMNFTQIEAALKKAGAK